jgi:hypothetical protein
MMRFRQVKAACRHTSRRTYHREYTPPTYEELVAGSAVRAARIQMAQVSPLAKDPMDHLADLFADVECRGMSVTDVFLSSPTMQIVRDSRVFTADWDGEKLWGATITILDSMRRGDVILVEGSLRYGGTNQSTPADCQKIPSVRGSLLPWTSTR